MFILMNSMLVALNILKHTCGRRPLPLAVHFLSFQNNTPDIPDRSLYLVSHEQEFLSDLIDVEVDFLLLGYLIDEEQYVLANT